MCVSSERHLANAASGTVRRATLPRFDLEHPARLRAIERAMPPGLALLGNYLHGIGVNHLVAAARDLASKCQS